MNSTERGRRVRGGMLALLSMLTGAMPLATEARIVVPDPQLVPHITMGYKQPDGHFLGAAYEHFFPAFFTYLPGQIVTFEYDPAFPLPANQRLVFEQAASIWQKIYEDADFDGNPDLVVTDADTLQVMWEDIAAGESTFPTLEEHAKLVELYPPPAGAGGTRAPVER